MKKDTPLSVRLPAETLAALDAFAERLRREHPGPRWSRSDVVRLLIDRGLREGEKNRVPRPSVDG